jgi:hypothetical protein
MNGKPFRFFRGIFAARAKAAEDIPIGGIELVSYKVVVNGDRKHIYSLWFRTRAAAREYKKILRKDKVFTDIRIFRHEETPEGYILEDREVR